MERLRIPCGRAPLALLVLFAALVATRANAAEPVTAIDILLLPDETMIARANAANAALRANYPAGFALDATHHPHISLLQRYVRTRDLPAVYAAVDQVFDRARPAGWRLEATGYFHVIFGGMGLPGIVVRPTPQMIQLQQELVDAVEPYTVPTGTAAAFATPANDHDVNQSTIDYVAAFVPNEIGKRYNPHVTVGVGYPDFVDRMQAAPFDKFQFEIVGAAVFHLGNFGTAYTKLWQWQPAER